MCVYTHTYSTLVITKRSSQCHPHRSITQHHCYCFSRHILNKMLHIWFSRNKGCRYSGDEETKSHLQEAEGFPKFECGSADRRSTGNHAWSQPMKRVMFTAVRVVKPLMSRLLKPAGRDIPERAEVQSAYPRVTFKNAPCLSRLRQERPCLPLTRVCSTIHRSIDAANPCCSGDQAFPVKK